MVSESFVACDKPQRAVVHSIEPLHIFGRGVHHVQQIITVKQENEHIKQSCSGSIGRAGFVSKIKTLLELQFHY